ncbi:Dev_Cell_Death domain-containing protein [Cephalotus follicularis]|uniref:Dev_Cell_Death domain-containing protein n=1 Tax=Cephalotus follicularis TaxID=3775 RepID=A0A1Q3C069_CEPFO|nr:Dev_Cell_Death domain-containing protein [Cephalotus follicularis]
MRKKIIPGSFPDFGVIFMSNGSTIKECLEKKLFGLPSSSTDFVRRVKAGMILFLFEYEERKLYGVFEAALDGETNIDPHAYKASGGRHFPAQVRITIIWNCDPLSEHEFHDAIKENYFASYKFNFGLSKDQVRKLLWLFQSRRVRVPKFQSNTKTKVRKPQQKSTRKKREMEKDMLNYSDSARRKLEINMGIKSVFSFEEADLSHSKLEPLAYPARVVSGKDDSQWSTSRNVDVTPNQSDNTTYDYSYCPEAPCLQSSPAFGTSSSTSVYELGLHPNHATSGEVPEKLNICSGSLIKEPEKLHLSFRSSAEEPEKLNISSGCMNNDLGDFIPLPPLHDSASPEDNISFSEAGCIEDNIMESAAVEPLCEPYVFPKPNLPGKSFGHENTGSPIAAIIPDGGPCDKNVKSSSAASPMNTCDCRNEGTYGLKSQVVDCQEHSDLDSSDLLPLVKRLYSDNQIKRTSVFSRLNFASISNSQEKVDHTRGNNSSLHVADAQNKDKEEVGKSASKISLKREDYTRMDKSVQEIMEELQQRHFKWSKTVRRDESLEQEDEGCTEQKKPNVFLRLTMTSEAGMHENENSIRLRQGNVKRKKRPENTNSTVLGRKRYRRVDKSLNNSSRGFQQNVTPRKKFTATEISITHHDYEENMNKNTHTEMANYGSGGNKGEEGNGLDASCLDIKSRDEMLETESETGRESCILSVDKNFSLENQRKRKLMVI